MKKITFLFFTLLLTVTSWRVSGQFTEGFESGIPASWTVLNAGDTNTWTTSTFAPHSGLTNALIVYSATPHDDYLVTPAITVVAGINDQLSFWAKSRDPLYPEIVDVKLSTTTATAAAFTVTLIDNLAPPSGTVYYKYFVDLTAYVGQTVYIGFHSTTTDMFVFEIDDVASEPIPTCVEPSMLSASNISTNSADLSWTSGGTESSWNIQYGASGFTLGTGTIVNGVTNPYTLSGLAPASTLQYYVQASCGGALGNSTWAGPFAFTTLCDTQNVPYALDFEEVTVPALPLCTQNVNEGTGNNWVTAAAPGSGFTTITLRYAYNASADANTWFFTNALNLTGGTSYRIEFDYGNNSTTYVESLKVAFGTSKTGAGMTDVIVDYPSIATNALQHAIVDFTPSTTGVYYVGFQAYSIADQWNLYVDNINIVETPACPAPTAFVLDAADATSATFSWTAGGTETQWDVEWGTDGFAQGAGTTVSGITTNPYTLSGLVYGTDYDVYLRANCGTSQSTWVGPISWRYLDLSDCVTVVSPLDAAVDVPVGDVTFAWSASSTGEPAVSYNLYYGLTASTVTTLVGNFTTTSQLISVEGFLTTFYWKIVPVNANGDESEGCPVWSFTTEAYVPPVCTVTEYFEETTVPSGWSTVINAGTCDFTFGSGVMPTGPDFLSGAAIFNDDDCGEAGGVNNVSLLSPVYDMSGATSASLGFDVAFQDFAGSGEFSVEVYNGTAWVEIVNYNTTDLAEILSASFDVLSYANSAFQVRFTYDDEGDWAWGAGLDNFCINTDAPGLGIANEIIDGFAMYPNPVENTLTLRAQNAIDAVSVYNMLGQEVMKSIPNATQVQFDMTQLPVGTYVVKVQAGSQLGSYSLIKQ